MIQKKETEHEEAEPTNAKTKNGFNCLSRAKQSQNSEPESSIEFGSIFTTSNDWDDFNNQLADLTKKEKSRCFELLSKYYLIINSKYRTSFKQVWLLEEVPENVRAFLNLPGDDEGIDIIAETKEGKYWSVQSKYRSSEDHSLGRKELGTFMDLSFNICKHIRHALICTNAKRLSRKFSLYDEKVSFCASDIWCNLDKHFFDNIRHLLKGIRVEPILFSPKKHQQEAIKNALKHFKDNSRGKLIHPCSSGKTLTAYWIARALEARTILVTVPTLNLINQMLEVWTNQFIRDGIDVSWVCVCSDQTVKNISVDSNECEARDLGIEVFNCPKAISKWLSKTKSQFRVVFSTYQSGMAVSEAVETSGTDFDLAIMDEAHKTVGQKDGLFTHLLDDQNIRVSKRLFMTATERRFKGGGSDEILSMEKKEVYGQTFDFYSFKDAIEDGILSEYKIVTIQVTQAKTKKLIEGNFYVRPQHKSWKIDIESQVLASLIVLRKASEKYGFSHTISYHSSLNGANFFKEVQALYGNLYLNNDPFRVFHVRGTTPAGQRVKMFKEFSAARCGLITNARCLTEGVNLPKVDSILFADPKKSKVDIVQAIGRALRIHKDKKMSYIIVPVLVDENTDTLDDIKLKTFKAVLQIAKALASQDERIIEYFRAISSNPKGSIPRGFSPLELDIPISKAIDLQKFHKDISSLLWNEVARISKRPFEEARSFVNVLGLKNHEEWKAYCNGKYANLPSKPQDIPKAPWIAYENQGWVSMGDWLGTGFIATCRREYRPFLDARESVHRLKLKNVAEWRLYSKGELDGYQKQFDDIPANPDTVYKGKGWKGFGDWLGTNTIATRNLQFRPFEEALNFTHSLGLKTQTEWQKFCRGELPGKGIKPQDIPKNPQRTYKDCGWINYGHWLGTGYVGPRYRKYCSYLEARGFAHKLGLKSSKEWRAYCKGKYPDKPLKPQDIPAGPHSTYKDKGWIGYGDFLGTGIVACHKRTYLSYKEAKSVIQGLNMKSQEDWKAYCKGTNSEFGLKPDNIPAAPNLKYSEWSSWGEWLGTGYVACSKREYLSFEKARKFVHSLGLNQGEWRSYIKGKLKELPPLPLTIPANPNQTYKNKGWVSMGDWLGTGYVACSKREYPPFLEARSFVRELKLKNQKEWKLYCKGELKGHKKKPENISSAPDRTYKDEGWISLGDWLGTGFIAYSKREYLNYEKARQFVHKLKLTNTTDWARYCNGELVHLPKKPDNISNRPEITYKNKGWVDWANWLGASYIPTRPTYRAFEDARDFARKLNLIRHADWKRYCQGKIDGLPEIPQDIPLKPDRTYRKLGWKGYPDWLGNTRRVSPRFIPYLSFFEAKNFVRSLNLKSYKEWSAYCKGKREDLGEKPQNIPTQPDRAYKDLGWDGYGDWLGTGTPAPGSRKFLSYEEAKPFVHKLKLKSRSEWNQYCSGKLPNTPPLPDNIPKDPNSVYKDKGWLSVGDWLGTNRKATHLRSYMTYEEARSFVRKLNLRNRDEWRSYCRDELSDRPSLPDTIPRAPWIVYKDKGWVSFSDWIEKSSSLKNCPLQIVVEPKKIDSTECQKNIKTKKKKGGKSGI